MPPPDPALHDTSAAAAAPASPARRDVLRVLAQDLTDADVAKLATFMRVSRDRLHHEWKLVFEGEAHVLLFGGAEPCTVMGMLDSPLETRRVADVAGPESATLLRPLQYDALLDTLLEVEQRIGTPAPPPSPISRWRGARCRTSSAS